MLWKVESASCDRDSPPNIAFRARYRGSDAIAAIARRADDKMPGCLEAAGIVKAATWIVLLSGIVNEILVLPENQP